MHQGILTIGAARLEIVSKTQEFEISQREKNHEIPDTDDLRRPSAFGGCAAGPLAAQTADRRNTGLRGGTGGVRLSVSTQHFAFTSQRQSLQMAYLDVKPDRPNGRTAVLLHGKNFCAATWEPTIKDLVAAGYRVIAPDQIGFCKSSKPAAYQFTFKQLAGNTHELLVSLGIEKPVVIGHSTGGMLAAHYSLIYPHDVSHLVLVNPVGLEDWSAKGVQSDLDRTMVRP